MPGLTKNNGHPSFEKVIHCAVDDLEKYDFQRSACGIFWHLGATEKSTQISGSTFLRNDHDSWY